MDPVRNPYNPGAGSRPPALVGREQQLEEFDIAIQRLSLGKSAKSMLLTGLRGVGKTVLLNEFQLLANRRQWIYEPLEANPEIDFPRAMGTLVRKAALRLSAKERMSDRTRRALSVIRSFQVTWNVPDLGTVKVDPMIGISDSGVLDADLAELLIELGDLANDHDRGVLFTIDEMQYLAKDHLAALIQALHTVAQRQLPIIVSGAGLPSLLGAIGDARSYAERLFDFPVIDSLDDDAAADALTIPAEEEGVRWDRAGVQRVVELAKGYPYFLQEFGKQTWDMAAGPDEISLSDVDYAMPLAIDALDDGFFRVRIDRANDSERRYLRAMASLGGGPYRSRDVADQLGKSTRELGPVRDALVKRGTCYSPRWGQIDFTVPMFDEFIRRTMP